jgi:multicomponent Na+:H+ antiporter subunit D
MAWLVLTPLLIPLLSAALALATYRSLLIQRIVAVTATVGLLTASIALLLIVRNQGPQAVHVGEWPAPFGIVIVADLFSAIMVVLAGIVGTVVVFYSYHSVGRRREHFGYYPLVLILLLGVCGAFLTGDLFNLYVWFEVMLIASFVLLVLGNERPQVEGALKYVTLNLFSSMLFLTGVGLLYGLTGTLTMADLARAVADVDEGLRIPVAMLFLVAFGIKAGAFPLFFWLPASYHTPPTAVSALFAGLLTKVGVYAMVRVFTLVFIGDSDVIHTVITVGAGLTMAVGVLGAVAQHEFRRILAFHSVSQIGYMLVGLGLLTPFGLAGTIFFVVHHAVVKTSLFLVSGVAERIRGTGELSGIGGLAKSHVAAAWLFALPALSLAGIPPSSGFVAKVAVVRSSMDETSYVVAGVALAVSMLTVFSMLKIWNEVFWKPRAEDAPPAPPYHLSMVIPLAVLVGVTLALAAAAGPVFDLALDAADQLVSREEYITAVMGETP